MSAILAQSRPAPRAQDSIVIDELLALRFWPPAQGKQSIRSALRDGRHLSPVRGRGMEFDDVRAYQHGDDTRHLDWRLLARTGEPHTRLFREEREKPVYLLADMGFQMQFASRGHLKSLLVAYASGLISWAAHSGGDRVGGQLLLADGESRFFRPRSNRQNISAMLAEFANGVGMVGSSRSQLTDALVTAEGQLPTGSRCYLMSDFHHVDSDTERLLERLARRCELNLIMITDPLERALPEADSLCFSSGGQRISVAAQDRQTRDRYAANFKARQSRIERLGQFPGIYSYHWSTDAHPLFQTEEFGG